MTVKFESTPQPPDTTLEWDFGDGHTSAEPFPVHRYTAAGSYTVRLISSNLGGDDISVKPGMITVLAGETVQLGEVRLAEAVPLEVRVREPSGLLGWVSAYLWGPPSAVMAIAGLRCCPEATLFTVISANF